MCSSLPATSKRTGWTSFAAYSLMRKQKGFSFPQTRVPTTFPNTKTPWMAASYHGRVGEKCTCAAEHSSHKAAMLGSESLAPRVMSLSGRCKEGLAGLSLREEASCMLHSSSLTRHGPTHPPCPATPGWHLCTETLGLTRC